MGLPWRHRDLPWDFHGSPIGLPWVYSALMGLTCVAHGVFMGLPWIVIDIVCSHGFLL